MRSLCFQLLISGSQNSCENTNNRKIEQCNKKEKYQGKMFQVCLCVQLSFKLKRKSISAQTKHIVIFPSLLFLYTGNVSIWIAKNEKCAVFTKSNDLGF